jgi:hypothetical protein
MQALTSATTATTNSTIELILTTVPAPVTPMSQYENVVPSNWFRAGRRMRLQHEPLKPHPAGRAEEMLRLKRFDKPAIHCR